MTDVQKPIWTQCHKAWTAITLILLVVSSSENLSSQDTQHTSQETISPSWLWDS